MRIVFCDDDIEILNQLQRYVSEFFRGLGSTMPEFAFYESGDELLEHETSLDIAFLDVEMPGRSGIYVGAILKKINPQAKIFIVTSYPDYLDEAMRFQVFRYLLANKVERGIITPKRAAEKLAGLCHCGVFNPDRAARIFEKMSV